MIKDFIKEYAKLIVSHPEKIDVDEKEIDTNFHEITIFASEEDLGKLIGKNGNMITSLKTIINGCKAKNSISYKIQVSKV